MINTFLIKKKVKEIFFERIKQINFFMFLLKEEILMRITKVLENDKGIEPGLISSLKEIKKVLADLKSLEVPNCQIEIFFILYNRIGHIKILSGNTSYASKSIFALFNLLVFYLDEYMCTIMMNNIAYDCLFDKLFKYMSKNVDAMGSGYFTILHKIFKLNDYYFKFFKNFREILTKSNSSKIFIFNNFSSFISLNKRKMSSSKILTLYTKSRTKKSGRLSIINAHFFNNIAFTQRTNDSNFNTLILNKRFRDYFNALLLLFKKNFEIKASSAEICRICNTSITVDELIRHSYFCRETRIYTNNLAKVKNDIDKMLVQIHISKQDFKQKSFLNSKSYSVSILFSPYSEIKSKLKQLSQDSPDSIKTNDTANSDNNNSDVFDCLIRSLKLENDRTFVQYSKQPDKLMNLNMLMVSTLGIIIQEADSELFKKLLFLLNSKYESIRYLFTLNYYFKYNCEDISNFEFDLIDIQQFFNERNLLPLNDGKLKKSKSVQVNDILKKTFEQERGFNVDNKPERKNPSKIKSISTSLKESFIESINSINITKLKTGSETSGDLNNSNLDSSRNSEEHNSIKINKKNLINPEKGAPLIKKNSLFKKGKIEHDSSSESSNDDFEEPFNQLIEIIDYNDMSEFNDFSNVNTQESENAKREVSIDDFTFISTIGKGGYGRVDLFKKKDTGDYFAVKIIDKEKTKWEFIEKETLILNEISNEFLVKCFYIFSDDNYIYYVMEYIPGGDLSSFMESTAYGKEIIKLIATEIILALEYIHSKGIIHKDLKPENVLISNNGHLKLTDFGISDIKTTHNKFAIISNDGLEPLNNSKTEIVDTDYFRVEGTPNYIAPEVIKDEPRDYSLDLWALGVILYELYTYRQPFKAENVSIIYDNILNLRVDWDLLKEAVNNDNNAYDLIRSFLVLDPEQRLKNYSVIKSHPYFSDVEWDDVYKYDNRFMKGYVLKRVKNNQIKKQTHQDSSSSTNSDPAKKMIYFSKRVDNLHILNLREWKKKTTGEIKDSLYSTSFLINIMSNK
jgi:serine/threonine protein kinase